MVSRILFFHLSVIYIALAQNINFKHLTVEDGLSQNTINRIFQDSHGFIWFGTQDGLNRYDGYNFKILRHDPLDSTSISHSWIWDVFEDSRKNLWIATWNGLNRYDPHNNKFIKYYPSAEDSFAMKGTRPDAICEDNEGFIWVGTWGGGLNRYDYKTDRFYSYFHHAEDQNSLADDYIRCIYYSSKKELWIGTWNGLSRLKKTIDHTYQFMNYRHNPKNHDSISDNKIVCITEDRQGRLWIGTLGGGLNLFNEQDGSFSRYVHEESDPHSLSGNDISAICVDNEGTLWVGTVNSGMNIFNKNKNRFVHIRHNPDNKKSLKGDNVFSIYEDQSGLIWIGANGLNVYNPRLNRFKHFSSDYQKQNGLSNNKVTSFYKSKDGNIWIGTDGGGLNKYNPAQDKFSSYKRIPGNSNSLCGNNISSIVGNERYGFWIGTRAGGVCRFDEDSEKFYPLIPDQDKAKIIDYVNAMCMDGWGELWIATYNNGLIRYSINNADYSHFMTDPADTTTLSGNYLLSVYVDSQNDIWVGIWGGGLCRYHRDKDTFTRYAHNPVDPGSLGDNIVHCIYETVKAEKRILWVGTSGGLSSAEITESGLLEFEHISQKDGLPSNIIYGILEDRSGNLWLSTNMGLCCYNPERKTFTNYDIKDGLQSNEFNTGACLAAGDGQFYFGGINGYTNFFPDQIEKSAFVPNIRLTSFRVFDQPVSFNKSLNMLEKINLDYEQNFFSFEFTSMDFALPEKNKYAYMLEGFDKSWVYSGARRYASYTNLDPGEYVFKVKGTNSDGVWNEKGAEIKIIITPPYWQTWWFRFLLFISAIGILYIIHKYRLAKLLEIERMRIRIASDLHDDIGSTLTKIAINSEIIQNTDNSGRIKEASRKIGDMSREIIAAMSDIIWSIDARNDTLKDLLDRMRDFSSASLTEKNINLKFKTKGLMLAKKIPVQFRQNIFLIFKEAVHNVMKHAAADMVEINFNGTGGHYTLCIKDNGKGIDKDIIVKGNGIKNMKLRAGRIRSEIDIKNNQGTEICLTGRLP
ncbi:MAG: hypothetical protein JXR46_08070 [Calditrichaceae bacterium]|nr:hypothetical protein [Calditrichaceae bacterium]